MKALHSRTCRQKNFRRSIFLATDRVDIHIIEGDKNLIAFISLLHIRNYCIQKFIFQKKVCLGVGFPSQVASSRESAESRISEQILQTKIMQTEIMSIYGSPCYK